MARPPRPEKPELEGPAGRIETLLELPETEPEGVALICHPHPQQGGTLHNKVAHTLARAFLKRGMAVLRFNFRGVGKSEGDFDDARGEVDDALACLEYLQERWPGKPAWLSGFSFGAAVAMSSHPSPSKSGTTTALSPKPPEAAKAPPLFWISSTVHPNL